MLKKVCDLWSLGKPVQIETVSGMPQKKIKELRAENARPTQPASEPVLGKKYNPNPENECPDPHPGAYSGWKILSTFA